MKKFIDSNLHITSWDTIKPYFDDLQKRNIDTRGALEQWLQDRSDLYETLEEDLAWRYIRTNQDTSNQEYKNAYVKYITDILPYEEEAANKLDKKFITSPAINLLPSVPYGNMIKQTSLKLKTYSQKNIPLLAEMRQLEQKFAEIVSPLSITIDDKELTLQQASSLLENKDRAFRKDIYQKIVEKRKSVSTELDELFDKLVKLRHQIAINAGYKNYRDYKFDELGRTDYTPKDCHKFHRAIKLNIVPLVKQFYQTRKEKLNLKTLTPYDLSVDIWGDTPLVPKNILDDTIEAFSLLDSQFGNFISTMKENGLLDLESRKNKAPGGFNYPLYKSGMPFIFANFAGNFHDLQTMVHEGGHAIHTFLTASLPLVEFKEFPSEVAELASMSMELISMKHWHLFFNNLKDTNRAKLRQLENIIEVLPWIAMVDLFQHHIYLNPKLTPQERRNIWNEIYKEFSPDNLSWNEFEFYREILWQKQLHIFEVPFYYIEYGFAQLGAIAVWKNFTHNNKQGISAYKKALSLGYTRDISSIYQTAGAKFSFDQQYIKELVNFVNTQKEQIEL